MPDLSPLWIKVKGALFLVLGVTAAALVWIETPTLRSALLLAAAIWAFCRFYYFAFYVIEKYVDDDYRFSGLAGFFAYILRRRARTTATTPDASPTTKPP